ELGVDKDVAISRCRIARLEIVAAAAHCLDLAIFEESRTGTPNVVHIAFDQAVLSVDASRPKQGVLQAFYGGVAHAAAIATQKRQGLRLRASLGRLIVNRYVFEREIGDILDSEERSAASTGVEVIVVHASNDRRVSIITSDRQANLVREVNEAVVGARADAEGGGAVCGFHSALHTAEVSGAVQRDPQFR